MIEDQNPDLICLQEVDRHVERSRLDDQPRLLASALHSAGQLYQLNVRVRRGGYGNLILSRWPFLRTHQASLRHTWRKHRGAQLAVVDTPEGHLHLVNWHLGLAEHERHWQVDHLLAHHLFRESVHLPTLIVGDTNDWRNSLGRGPFARHDFTPATGPPSRFRIFPATMPVASLDKAFHCGPIAVRHAPVHHSPLATLASDHLPLVIGFHLQAERSS